MKIISCVILLFCYSLSKCFINKDMCESAVVTSSKYSHVMPIEDGPIAISQDVADSIPNIKMTDDKKDSIVNANLILLEKRMNEMKEVSKKYGNFNPSLYDKNVINMLEHMKPKQCARIIEQLDKELRAIIIKHMKPIKSSAVLSEMNPEKAKETIEILSDSIVGHFKGSV